MRKLVASTTIAASVLGGGVAALTLTPTGVGAQESDAATEQTDRASGVAAVLDGLVQDGTLTQEQRDSVEEALRNARPDIGARMRQHGHKFGPGRFLDGEILDDLGLAPEDIRQGLADGQTLGEIADANGSSADALVDAITDRLNQRLDEAVAAGRIDEADADDRRGQIDERVEDLVNKEFDRLNHDGFGRRGPAHDSGEETGA